MIRTYFKNLYGRTMQKSYSRAYVEILKSLSDGGKCLDCGASKGAMYDFLKSNSPFQLERYVGIEWSAPLVESAQSRGLNVIQGDLNKPLEFASGEFKCIFGLSLLEHLINPCRFLRETYRCLERNGTLIILTPNISTFFTIALLLVGKMPSSGPHPDSDLLLKNEELFKVSSDDLDYDTESDMPVHRHIVIFSYRVSRSYLSMVGFREIKGYGFGLYPFPNFMQNVLERLDPYHCHQMVFVAKK